MTTTPPALKKGDLIAILSPSSRLNDIFPHRIARARTYLEESLGFRAKVIFNPSVSHSPFPTSTKLRCEEIHSAFHDPEIKAIICAIGGTSCNELLRHLDYTLIAANPKIFVGYSDITLLHHAFAIQAGLRTFYGPAAITQFGEFPEPLGFTVQHFRSVLCESVGRAPGPVPRAGEWTQVFAPWGTEAETAGPRALQGSSGWRWLRRGKARGRISGGCLPSLCQLAGTKYWPDLKDYILILENPEGQSVDGPFPLEATQACVTDLVNLNVFDDIAGLVLGRPFQYDGEMTARYERMFLELCSGEGRDFPILANVDIGHTDPMLTIPLGCMASLSSEDDEFALLEAAVV